MTERDEFAAAARVRKEKICTWTAGDVGSYYTQCGHRFFLEEGGPSDNGMIYCCYCGKELIEEDCECE